MKFAKDSLYLAKKIGGSLFGEFHSESEVIKLKDTQRLNEIDSYNILHDISSGKEKEKYKNKKSKLSKLITKNIENDGLKTSNRKWTKSYDNVVKGVKVWDRRTEISCMTDFAIEKFSNMFKDINISTDKVGSVMFTYNDGKPTYANVEDLSKINEVEDVLINDAYNGLNNIQYSNAVKKFPITVVTRIIDLKSTKYEEKSYVISNFDELKKIIDSKNPVIIESSR